MAGSFCCAAARDSNSLRFYICSHLISKELEKKGMELAIWAYRKDTGDEVGKIMVIIYILKRKKPF